MRAIRFVFLFLSAVLSGSPALADVLVVDAAAGDGYDFLDIPPAVDAATPGDTILVRAGSYSSFTLEEPIAIVGTPGLTTVASGVQVSNPGPLRHAVLADLVLSDLLVNRSRGPVVLDGLTFDGLSSLQSRLVIRDCTDVRVHVGRFGAVTDLDGIYAESSRVEVVQCVVLGGSGHDGQCGSDPGDGGDGIDALAGRIHVSSSTVRGGHGGVRWNPNCLGCYEFGGDGGHGIRVSHGEAIVAGSASDLIRGGDFGNGFSCDCDGYPGSGIEVISGSLRYSGVTIRAGDPYPACHHVVGPIATGGTSTVLLAVPADLTLERIGRPALGRSVRLRVRGEPGALIRLHTGRLAQVVPDPDPEVVEVLTSGERTLLLGPMPPGGEMSVDLSFPPAHPPGTTWFWQASASGGSAFQRSNSVPVVLR